MSRRKRMATKWCASTGNGTIPDGASATTADGAELCATTTAVIDEPDILAGWCIGDIQVSRLDAATQNAAIAWAIVMQRLSVGTVTPAQVFSPFSRNHLERQDILAMGMIPTPPIIFVPSTDAPATDRSSVTVQVRCRVGRKLDRNTNNLFLWIASTDNVPPGTDNAFHAWWNIRTLMKFP